jgi:diacylglycerol kinase family enzyme
LHRIALGRVARRNPRKTGRIRFIVRFGAISRLGALRHLPGIYDGSHMKHPLAWRRSARIVELLFDAPTEIVIDGEVLSLTCERIDLLPAAIDVAV